jgi:hypothetical protein
LKGSNVTVVSPVQIRSARWGVDHLIPLCLGGADDNKNLWPQPRRSLEAEWNAERKDALERRLCEMACAGELDVRRRRKPSQRIGPKNTAGDSNCARRIRGDVMDDGIIILLLVAMTLILLAASWDSPAPPAVIHMPPGTTVK